MFPATTVVYHIIYIVLIVLREYCYNTYDMYHSIIHATYIFYSGGSSSPFRVPIYIRRTYYMLNYFERK